MTNDNFCFYLQNRLIHTSQTGGQQYFPLLEFPAMSVMRSLWFRQETETADLQFRPIRRSNPRFRRKTVPSAGRWKCYKPFFFVADNPD